MNHHPFERPAAAIRAAPDGDTITCSNVFWAATRIGLSRVDRRNRQTNNDLVNTPRCESTS